jgi:heme exporter protein A
MKRTERARMSGINIHSLSIERGGRPIFWNLELSHPPGKSLRLVGPNGCGKSSLLKTMAGRISPRSGSILWNNHPIHSQDVIFLDHHLLMKDVLTVEENLGFWASIYGATPSQLESAIVRMGLQRLHRLPFSILSAGQKKRVQLALLFLKKSPVWLLDEPLLSLDPDTCVSLSQIIQHHLCNNGTMIYASHEPLPGLEDQTFDMAPHRNSTYAAIAA